LVKAKEIRSGVEQTVEVKPQYGLTDEEVEKMLMDSVTHAKEDMAIRALVEARTEARQILDTTSGFLQKNGSILTDEERTATDTSMASLKGLLENGNKDEIHTAIEKLNEISRPYAERLMDYAISTAMKGKKI